MTRAGADISRLHQSKSPAKCKINRSVSRHGGSRRETDQSSRSLLVIIIKRAARTRETGSSLSDADLDRARLQNK